MKRSFMFFCALGMLLCLPAQAASQDQDFVWNNGLRQAYFGDRAIAESADVIVLEAPQRAENAAIVPIKIKAQMAQSEDRYIKTITLLIDNNPVPFAGKFTFTPQSGRADLALRIRVNAYTPVRAIAETSDGELSMAKRFVKASGGCSAPAGTDLDTALSRLGKMKFKTDTAVPAGEPALAQLNISHPNVTGLQMDQVSRLYLPAHFVEQVKVTFNGEPILTAETDIAISEDPSFRFYFVPQEEGELRAEVRDSKGNTFTEVNIVEPL